MKKVSISSGMSWNMSPEDCVFPAGRVGGRGGGVLDFTLLQERT